MREELKCLNCGEGFIPTCHITRQKYCSNECRHRYNNAKRYYKGEVNICPECGDVVEQRERGAGRWRRFCSDRCRIKYDQRKIKERRMAKGVQSRSARIVGRNFNRNGEAGYRGNIAVTGARSNGGGNTGKHTRRRRKRRKNAGRAAPS